MTDAFHLIPATGCDDVFIFGDHASNFIPPEYDDLGLSGDELTRHIAWDIGTETIIRRLCAHFKCPGQLAAISRLVIDLNRDPKASGLIPEISDGTWVPGNQNISAKERQSRLKRYYAPYHRQLGETLDSLNQPFVLSIHSFTPKPREGEFRMTDIGLLIRHDEESAEHLRESFMRLGRNFTIGMNLPYSAYDLNYTVDEHVASRALRHLAIEIRQDHIDTQDKAEEMADILADRLELIVAGKFAPLPK